MMLSSKTLISACFFSSATMSERPALYASAWRCVTMLALMAAARYISAPLTRTETIAALETALVALTLTFRMLAQRRWSRLDWMLCRAEPGVRASA